MPIAGDAWCMRMSIIFTILMSLNCLAAERSTWLAFTAEEGRALREHDHVRLFELGAHPFLTLTLFIAMFERDHGPLEYQKAYAQAMEHIQLPYPDIAT